MELIVNENKKKELQKKIAGDMKAVRIIQVISKFLFFVGSIGGGLYIIVNFVVPSLSLVNVNGILRKDISWIIISASLLIVPCLLMSLFLNVLSKNLAGSFSVLRVDEGLFVNEGQLRYSFRIKHQSLSSERQVVSMDFSDVKSIEYYHETEGLVFKGNLRCCYYDDIKKEIPVDEGFVDEFIIYDYFSPSLIDALCDSGHGLLIKEM